FVRDGQSHSLTPQSAEVTLTDRLYNFDSAQSYSDHYGIIATVTLQPDEANQSTIPESARIAALSGLKQRLQSSQNETLIEQSSYSDHAFMGVAVFIDLLLAGSLF